MKNFFRRICYCLCNKSGTIPLVEEGEEKFGTGIQKLSQSASEEELFDNQIYYKIKNDEHVHYIKCIKCHKKEKLNLCPIKKIKGFEIIDHKIELNGICEKCKKSKN